MPNSIIPQDQDGKNIFNAISAFFRVFMIGKLAGPFSLECFHSE